MARRKDGSTGRNQGKGTSARLRAEAASLRLLRAEGDPALREKWLRTVLTAVGDPSATESPLLLAAVIAALADPTRELREYAQRQLWIHFDQRLPRQFADDDLLAGDDPVRHLEAVRLACAGLPRAREIIVGLGPTRLASALTSTPPGGESGGPLDTVKEDRMAPPAPPDTLSVEVCLSVEAEQKLRAKAASAGQSVGEYIGRLAEDHVRDTPADPDPMSQGLRWLLTRTPEDVQQARARILAAAPPPRAVPAGKTILDVVEGSWPGTESDAEIREALDRMS